MPKLTESELLARDAGRDLNAELLEAAADMQAGRVGLPSASNFGLLGGQFVTSSAPDPPSRSW